MTQGDYIFQIRYLKKFPVEDGNSVYSWRLVIGDNSYISSATKNHFVSWPDKFIFNGEIEQFNVIIECDTDSRVPQKYSYLKKDLKETIIKEDSFVLRIIKEDDIGEESLNESYPKLYYRTVYNERKMFASFNKFRDFFGRERDLEWHEKNILVCVYEKFKKDKEIFEFFLNSNSQCEEKDDKVVVEVPFTPLEEMFNTTNRNDFITCKFYDKTKGNFNEDVKYKISIPEDYITICNMGIDTNPFNFKFINYEQIENEHEGGKLKENKRRGGKSKEYKHGGEKFKKNKQGGEKTKEYKQGGKKTKEYKQGGEKTKEYTFKELLKHYGNKVSKDIFTKSTHNYTILIIKLSSVMKISEYNDILYDISHLPLSIILIYPKETDISALNAMQSGVSNALTEFTPNITKVVACDRKEEFLRNLSANVQKQQQNYYSYVTGICPNYFAAHTSEEEEEED